MNLKISCLVQSLVDVFIDVTSSSKTYSFSKNCFAKAFARHLNDTFALVITATGADGT